MGHQFVEFDSLFGVLTKQCIQQILAVLRNSNGFWQLQVSYADFVVGLFEGICLERWDAEQHVVHHAT